MSASMNLESSSQQRVSRRLEQLLNGIFHHKRPIVLLAVITIVGIFLRLFAASFLPIDRDEGQFLYYGERALNGALPLRDLVPEPDPLYIWMVAGMELLMGAQLLTIRLLSIASSGIGVIALYFLINKVTSQRLAMFGALLYSVSPTIVLYNVIGNYRQVAWPMVIVSLYFLAVGIKENDWKSLFVFGAIAGLATATYRITGIFLVTSPLLVALLYRSKLRTSLKPISSIIGGGAVTLLATLGPIIYLSGFDWVNRVWGFGGGIGSASDFATNVFTQAGIATYQIDTPIRIAFVDAREWYYLILTGLSGTVALLKSSIVRRALLAYVWPGALIIATSIVSIAPFLPSNPNFGAYPVSPHYDYATLVIIWLGTFGIIGLVRISKPTAYLPFGRNTVFYWIVSLIAAFSLFRYGHVFYFVAFAAPLCFLSAFGLQELSRPLCAHPMRILSWHGMLSTFILSLTLSSAVVATASMYTTPIQERDVTQSQAVAIGEYISSHTKPTDQILTGNLIYAIDSDRNNELNLPQAYIYFQTGDNPFPGNPFGTIPTITEINANLTTGRVVYVVMDTLLDQIMLFHPVLRDTINAHFTLETTLYGVQLWRFLGQ